MAEVFFLIIIVTQVVTVVLGNTFEILWNSQEYSPACSWFRALVVAT